MKILAAQRLFASWEASTSRQEVHIDNVLTKGDKATVTLEDAVFTITYVVKNKLVFSKTLALHTPNTYAKINKILNSHKLPPVPKPVFVRGFRL